MTATASPLTMVESLAAKLEDDIRRRGLRPGDRYLTAAEAGELFAASSMSVNRAMQKLAACELLVRSRSRGTFIGPKAVNDDVRSHPFDVIHLLMAMDLHDTHSFSSDEVVDAVRAALPEVVVQVHYIPEASAGAYVNRALERLSDATSTEGLLLFRCSRQVQGLVEKSGLAAAIFGHAYPGIQLPWVEPDQEQVGRLLAECMLKRGYPRCALITRCLWRFGDNLMLNALTDVLGRAGIALNDLQTRSVALDQETILSVVEEIVEWSKGQVMFLCRNDSYAEAVAAALKKLGRSPGDGVEVVSGGGGQIASAGGMDFPRVVSTLSLREQIEHAATLLCEAAEKKSPRCIVVPVAFQELNASTDPKKQV